jgi:hypothetical protein
MLDGTLLLAEPNRLLAGERRKATHAVGYAFQSAAQQFIRPPFQKMAQNRHKPSGKRKSTYNG